MRNILFTALVLALSLPAFAADSKAKDEVIKAAKALGEKPNYSWRSVVTVPESAQFKPGPTEGKTEKEGATHLLLTFGDNTVEAFIKGDKGASKNQEGEWRTTSELESSEGPGRFMGRMLRNFKSPATQAAELAAETKELKKEGDAYSGELTEEGAKSLFAFRRRGESGGPQVSNAKGNVKFWIKDGVLSKFEHQVKGSVNFNGNDVDVDRSTVIEIKDVGSTKVVVPEEATKKLS